MDASSPDGSMYDDTLDNGLEAPMEGSSRETSECRFSLSLTNSVTRSLSDEHEELVDTASLSLPLSSERTF